MHDNRDLVETYLLDIGILIATSACRQCTYLPLGRYLGRYLMNVPNAAPKTGGPVTNI